MLRASMKSLLLLPMLFLSGSALAVPLNLTLLLPDVVSGTIDVTHVASTDAFSASGFALELDDDGVLPNIQLDAPGGFSISAVITDAGVLTSGSISITGTIASEGYVSGTLLTGDLTDFGWFGDTSGMIFEFEFDVTGGDLAASYAGAPGGVILGTGANTFGGFGADFNNLIFDIPGTGAGTSDTAPIPEPGTALLLGVGLLALARTRARR